MTRFGMMCAALAAGMMIATMANAAEMIGQDDFDSNRDFLSFTQSLEAPSPDVYEAFDITSYAEVLTQGRALLASHDAFGSPLKDTATDKFWLAKPVSGATLTWTFSTGGYSDLTFAFDLAKSPNVHGANELELLAGFDGDPLSQVAATSIGTNNDPFIFDGIQLANDSSPSRIEAAIPGSGDVLTVQFLIGGRVPTLTQFGNMNQLTFDNIELTGVPEPASMALLGLGGLTVLARRRRRTA